MNGEEIIILGAKLQKIENNEELVKLGKELYSLGLNLHIVEHKRKLREAEDNFPMPQSKEFLGGFEWKITKSKTYYGPSWELVGTPATDEAKYFMESFTNLHKLNGGWSDHPLIKKFRHEVMREWFPADVTDIEWPKECLTVKFNGYRSAIQASIAFAKWLKDCNFVTIVNRDEIADSLEKTFEEHRERITKEFQETNQALDQALRDLASHTNPLHVFEEVDWQSVIDKSKPMPIRITNPKTLKHSLEKGCYFFVVRSPGSSFVNTTWTHRTPEDMESALSNNIAVYRCLNAAVAELVTKENK